MTVVVGVDGSDSSKAALRIAAQEARWRQASLVAVTAYEPPVSAPGGYPGGYPAGAMHTPQEEKATAESALRDTVAHELGDQAGQTDMRVSAGLAGRVIIEAAKQTQAELIVLAASPGKSMLPGTVSQYVLLKAECPVMIVPSDNKHAEKKAEGPA
jgi:nucleotide-binding universal stress UspA family protein